MESFCRGCLSKYDQVELIQYNEKNRRLFLYSTGLQVKRNDSFTFQLCKDCFMNMKAACNFKKTCRNSDKKLKSYLELKESGDNVEFCTFLKNNEDLLKFRLPINIGNSTPANKNRDDDNESTCTSIQNFMTDILQVEEIPDNEARIIRQVIEEETDILEDTLDSHWLQDDVSICSDFRLDFSFSPFSTPRSVSNDNEQTCKNIANNIETKKVDEDVQEFDIENVVANNVDHDLIGENFFNLNGNQVTNRQPILQAEAKQSEVTNEICPKVEPEDKKCVIDVNLENALKNDTAQKVLLDDLLATPPMIPNISGPPTPVITGILFGETKNDNREYVAKNKDNIQEDIDVIDEFLNIEPMKENNDVIEFDNSIMDIEEVESLDKYFNKPPNGSTKEIKRPPSPIEDNYCISNFYCKMCNRKFKNLVALKVHCTKHHKLKIEKPKSKRIRKKYICDYCGQLFASSRCVAKHLERHQQMKTYECKRCTMTFSTESRMKLHESSHTGVKSRNTNNNKKYVCSICGAACSSSSNYNIHKRRHLNNFTISCEHCGKGFFRTSDLTVHMRQHTGERPYQCRYCPRSFSRQDILSRHMKLHIGEKPFECQFCDAKFCKAYELKLHQSKSKLCVQRQIEIVEKEKNVIIDDILVTNAFVT
ncbi:zinc finger protein 1 homolog [Melitaea cinxia]|uniref:zinc finger protein 1 homolog n=1 Tax=Melitaea cinxia TaxID=113334 RepID=UPI001E272A9B|nr:zinc finger protein 1 homolog [Melitaea cinxia]